ncbi:MAG TPA: gamma-glutamylcyclotransferase [Mycobacteriales bacterium]|nr:gamma-glutamylcyclotransferase [Mycobacteriales bacterium]
MSEPALVRMFLNGTAMSGQKDHGLVAAARLLGARRTAPKYRFVAVRDEFPGLLPVGSGGVSVTGELYEMTEEMLRDSLLPGEPAELELDTVELADGEVASAMRLRPERLRPGDKVVDIADLGGWRAYQAHLEAQRTLPSLLGRPAHEPGPAGAPAPPAPPSPVEPGPAAQPGLTARPGSAVEQVPPAGSVSVGQRGLAAERGSGVDPEPPAPAR